MAFQGFLKQSTAVDVLLGPFLDETDGKTAEEALTIEDEHVFLSKNAQGLAAKNDANDAGHDAAGGGYHNCPLNDTDTATVGQLTIACHMSGALPVRLDYHVVEEAVYDAMYGGSAAGPLQSTTAGRKLDVNATGEAGLDFDNIKDATGAHTLTNITVPVATAVTNRVTADMTYIHGTALTETAGQLAGAFKKFFDVATPTGTINSIPDKVAGATDGLFIAGTNAATAITTALTANIVGDITGGLTGDITGNLSGSVGTLDGLAAASAAKLDDILDGTGGTGLTLNSLVISGTAAGGVVDIDNSGGPGIKVDGTTFGLEVAATATAGIGVSVTPGAQGTGLAIVGGSAWGSAVSFLAQDGTSAGLAIGGTGNQAGLYILGGGGGNGNGVTIIGTGTGAGVSLAGGATSGTGIQSTGGAPNGVGVTLNGTGTGADLDAELAAANFAADALVAATFATGALSADAFAANAIVAATLAADCITAAKIADDAIVDANFAAGAFGALGIAQGTVASSSGTSIVIDAMSPNYRDFAGAQAGAFSDGTMFVRNNAGGTGGAPAGESRNITAWSGDGSGTWTLTIESAFSSDPADGAIVLLLPGQTMLADLTKIHGTALTETAGQLAGAFKKFFDVATPTGTINSIPDKVAGATDGLFIAGTNAATAITTALTANITGDITGGLTGDITGNLSGSVGTLTTKTGFSLATAPPTAAEVVNEWESQSQSDPTGFHVNVLEVGGTSQTANDNGADINANKVILDALTAAAATKLALSAGTIVVGTVDTVTNTHTPTTTVFQADDITEATGDHFIGRQVIFTTGDLTEQATDIADYAAVGGIGQFTVTALTEAPANNDTFIIV